jgi:hypothetical protein
MIIRSCLALIGKRQCAAERFRAVDAGIEDFRPRTADLHPLFGQVPCGAENLRVVDTFIRRFEEHTSVAWPSEPLVNAGNSFPPHPRGRDARSPEGEKCN